MHMENMVMGIAFGTAVTIFRNDHVTGYKGTYNQIKLQDIVEEEPKEFPVRGNRFSQISTDIFSNIPGFPIAYWLSTGMLGIFSGKSVKQYVRSDGQTKTGDNDKYLRLLWEVNAYTIGKEKKWVMHVKGGQFRKWYGNNDFLVNWKNDGEEIRAFKDENGKLRSRPQNMDFYFREGITWSTLSIGQLSMRFRQNSQMPTDRPPIRRIILHLSDKSARIILSLLLTRKRRHCY